VHLPKLLAHRVYFNHFDDEVILKATGGRFILLRMRCRAALTKKVWDI
jgi:hypothetical protein